MKKVAFLAMSIDGFIADKNGGLAWLEVVSREGEDYGYAKFFAGIDGLFIGRKTFDTALGFETWPYEGKRVFVRTHREVLGAPSSVVSLRGDLAENLSSIEASGIRNLYIDGGQLIRDALRIGALNELTVSLIPTLLGEGIRLFDHMPSPVRVNLKESRSFHSGLVQNTYVF